MEGWGQEPPPVSAAHSINTASPGRLITAKVHKLHNEKSVLMRDSGEEFCRPDGKEQHGPQQAVPLGSRRGATGAGSTDQLQQLPTPSHRAPGDAQ